MVGVGSLNVFPTSLIIYIISMAQRVTIPWDDGSGDNFYIDFSGVAGATTCPVTSDANLTGLERTKVLEFRTTTAGIPEASQASAYLTVVQKIDSLVVAMFENVVSIYDGQKAGYKEPTATYLRNLAGGLQKTEAGEKIKLTEKE